MSSVLQSLRAEKRVLRTLIDNTEEAAYAASVVRRDYFSDPHILEAFDLYVKEFSQGAKTKEWLTFIDSPELSPEARERLSKFKYGPISGLDSLKEAIGVLEDQAQRRHLFSKIENWAKLFENKKGNPKEIVSQVMQDITALNKASDLTQDTTSSGASRSDSKVLDLIRQMMTKQKGKFLKTGFKAWDDINGGILRGTFMLTGGPTGTGKSMISTIHGLQTAAAGGRVLKICLEMSEEHEMYRILGFLSGIKVSNIKRPETLSDDVKERLFKMYVKYDKHLKKVGGCFDIMVPKNGIRMEQLLLWLRSQKYDLVIIDYLGLMDGMNDTDQQWKHMGEAARMGALYCASTGLIMNCVVQVSDEGKMRYSGAVREHAALEFTWTRNSVVDANSEKVEKSKKAKSGPFVPLEYIEIIQPKCRNHEPVSFRLHLDYSRMQATEDANRLGQPQLPYLVSGEAWGDRKISKSKSEIKIKKAKKMKDHEKKRFFDRAKKKKSVEKESKRPILGISKDKKDKERLIKQRMKQMGKVRKAT